MDHLTPEERSRNMSKIRGTETAPERAVRSMLHRAGYRFRKNVKTLPGKPDIVLPKYRTVIFVHGCFWHRHEGCKDATMPKSNKAFWKKKFERNVSNDQKHARQLRKLGWRVITVWSCQLRKPEQVIRRLENKFPFS
jgi:DNA mismatch endonuclease (patch repair protein)